MEKILYEYLKDLSNEQLGELARTTIIYDKEDRIIEIKDSVAKLLFRTICKEYVDKKKDLAERRKGYGRKGGRPRKEKK